MRRLLYILTVLLLPLAAMAQDAEGNKSPKYLGDYVQDDLLVIVDGHIVLRDSAFPIEVEDIERVEMHGRGMHLYPELKYVLNGKPISHDEAGNIVVDDILWMKFVDNVTLSIITDPNMVLYVVDGRVADPDSLPERDEIVSETYTTLWPLCLD